MPRVKVGAATLFAEVQGEGDPIVLICGTGMDSQAWAMQAAPLAQSRRVVLFDSRDSGRSSYVDHDYTPADMARDTAELLGELGIERADVLGYSLGGAVAQELALAAPELVRSLVLLCTWAAPDAWLLQRFRAWERLATKLERADIVEVAMTDLFTPAWFQEPAGQEAFRALSAANPYPQRREGAVRQWRADQAHDARDRLDGIGCPALVVGGRVDPLVPVRFSEELAELIPDARLDVLDGAHAPHIEDVDTFLGILEAFLGSRA